MINSLTWMLSPYTVGLGLGAGGELSPLTVKKNFMCFSCIPYVRNISKASLLSSFSYSSKSLSRGYSSIPSTVPYLHALLISMRDE
jgi:hypothetical protein